MKGAHLAELFFHFPEDCQVLETNGGIQASRQGRSLRMQLPEAKGGSTRICCGQEQPPLGWISRRFDERLPAPVVAWSAPLDGATVLRTVILI